MPEATTEISRDMVLDVIQYATHSDVALDENATLQDLGLDSLSLIEAMEYLEAKYGVYLTLERFVRIETPPETVRELVAFFVD